MLHGSFLPKSSMCLLQLLDHFNDECHLEVYVAYSYYLGLYIFLCNHFNNWKCLWKAWSEPKLWIKVNQPK